MWYNAGLWHSMKLFKSAIDEGGDSLKYVLLDKRENTKIYITL